MKLMGTSRPLRPMIVQASTVTKVDRWSGVGGGLSGGTGFILGMAALLSTGGAHRRRSTAGDLPGKCLPRIEPQTAGAVESVSVRSAVMREGIRFAVRVPATHARPVILPTGTLSLRGLFALAAFFLGAAPCLHAQAWRTASRAPAGLAPDPARTREAVIQVYAARAVQWRGYFGVHPWIAVKRTDAERFTVHELMGYQTRSTGNGVRSHQRVPDMYWFGNRPWVLADLRGPGVDAIIDRIEAAVAAYPHAGDYHVWPGPNSNTFIAHILRAAPELRVDLPALAVGKDYLGSSLAARTPSGTGVQLNVRGVFGVLAGWEEGLELNVIGLTFGVNPVRLALKLPVVGNVGLRKVGEVQRLETP